MAGTVAEQPENPLSHLDWVAEHKKAEMREHFLDCFAQLDALGIKVVNC